MNLLSLPKVKGVKHTIEPVWASDAGRNSNSAKFSGTFVGWIDVLDVKVGKTNQTEMTAIRNAIEHPIIEDIVFVDSRTGNNRTSDFYGTAIGAETENTKKIYDPFSFSLKGIEVRDDM